MVRAARDGKHRRSRSCHAPLDLPPSMPAVAEALLPRGGVDAVIGSHREDVQMVGASRSDVDRGSGGRHSAANLLPGRPPCARTPPAGVNAKIRAHREYVKMVETARHRMNTASRRDRQTA